MSNPVEETQKRLLLVKKEVETFGDISLGIVLAGSVAYAPNSGVTEKSDVDLVVIVDDIRQNLEVIIEDEEEITALKNRFFEGYCIKKCVDGVPISIHFLSDDAFEIISRCFVADIRVYRPEAKPGSYQLRGFDGTLYDYYIKNIPLQDLKGVRTIVPISFINQDRYFIGIHRDKLLSHPQIVEEKDGYVADKIDKLWSSVVRNLHDESLRRLGVVDLDRMNVLNTLAKHNRFNADALAEVTDRTDFYFSQLR